METTKYYQKLLELSGGNKALWQACVIHTDGSSPAKAGMKLLIPPDGLCYGNLGGGEMEHQITSFVRKERPGAAMSISFDLGSLQIGEHQTTDMICGGLALVFIEPLHNAKSLYIIGAGHCGKALGELAIKCGYWVHLIDNRQDILDAAKAESGHERHLSDYNDVNSIIGSDPNARVVIMTHGHAHDRQVLQQCLRQDYRYLGMIGSKHKVAETFSLLKSQGFSEAELKKVHAPIGLRIGSQNPMEIAISIMAEIIREDRLGTG